MHETLLAVENLETQFVRGKRRVAIVKNVSFAIGRGAALGIVGESGCGKSITALSIMRLIEPPGAITGGKIVFRDNGKTVDLVTLAENELEKILGSRIAMIFQDPMTALNPVLTVGYQITETLRVHRRLSKREARAQSVRLLERVGINNAAERFNDYPHRFSGGMRQRAMIAMAIACQPALLIADEPTTALDVTIQAQILNLLRELKRDLMMSIIFITHDLGVVAELADRVAVMYAGRIVENASVAAVFDCPQHPYTAALVSSVPTLENQPRRLPTIEGAPPVFGETETGCSFYPRCPRRLARCQIERPPLIEVSAAHFAACWAAPLHGGALADG